VIGEVVIGDGGEWSFTPPALSDGDHSLTVVVKDPAGNTSSESESIDLKIDTVAPEAPTFNTLPGATNENPTLSGTGIPGETIVIRDNGSEIGSVVIKPDGSWSFTPSPALAEGEHSLTVEAVDAAGNVSSSSETQPVVIDTAVPDAPTFNSLPGATNENPTLSGTGIPGETIVIRDNGSEIGSVVIQPDGNWSFTSSPALGEGEHSLTVEAVDAAGNVSASEPQPVVIDTVAPDAPTFSTLPGATNESPTLSGTGSPGETIVIRDNGTEIGTVVIQPDGNWSFTPSPALGEGEHSLTVEVADAAGNVSVSAPQVIDIDTIAPLSVATLTYISKDSGFGDTDLVTNDGSAGRLMSGTLSSDLSKGEKVQVSLDNGATWMDAEVNGTNWFVMDNSSHSGDWTICARVVDATGNMGVESSSTVTLLNASARPSPPLVLTPTADGNVIVIFDPQTVKVGDRIVLTHYGARYEHVLTEAEVAAGAAAVNAAHVPERIDFSDFSYTSTENASSVDFHGLTMHFEGQVIKSTGPVLKGPGGGGHQKTTIDIDGGTNSVLIKLAGLDSTSRQTMYKFYDAEGNLIGTVDNTVNANGQHSGSLIQDYGHVMEFVAPEGHTIYSFTIETPNDTSGIYLESLSLGMGGGTDVMSAAIVDAAGNSSDLLTQAQSTIAQDFEVLSAQSLAIGQSRDIGSMTITALLKEFDPILKQVAGDASWGGKGYGSWLQATAGAAVGVELKGASGTRFTANFADINNTKSGQALRFYDADNNLILSVDLNAIGTGAEWGTHGVHTWEMPEGKSFTRFEFHGGTDRILMDNIRIDWVGEQAVMPVELMQEVHGGAGYQGDAADNVFNLADVSNLMNVYSNVDGGAGVDTLVLSGADQMLDFSLLSGKIDSMEVLDITGTGNNALKLSLGDVLDQGVKDLFHTDGNAQMMVRGDSGDTVTLDDILPNGITPGEWASSGTVDVGGVTYTSYQYSTLDAELLVQQGVTVNLV
ncbi:Ig-like domain repeat protein, partial [Pseudomonas chlororaphis]|uniref:Ig-like domain-containing protein n=1 Tax=Pseudomonas chlororaphis TaxID=587753 RepID=UPI001B325E84